VAIQETVLTRSQLTGVLRALGAAAFALILVIVGVLLSWFIVRNGYDTDDSLQLAHFLIWVGGVVGVAALAYIGKLLVTLPDATDAAPGHADDAHEAPPTATL
jgi:NhaP-type Na+/H+ or K+/H+ antiporter